MAQVEIKVGCKQGKEKVEKVHLSDHEVNKICQDFFNSKSYAENNNWLKLRNCNVEKLKTWKQPDNPIVLVFPFYSNDVDKAETLMSWICELDKSINHTCILHCDDETNYKKVLDLARTRFAHVKVSVYKRKEYKWPSSNSYAFVKASDYMDANLPNNSWLWMETDGIPVKKMWLSRLDIEYKDSNMPFFGNIVKIGNSRHMNGLAIYPPDIRSWTDKAFEIEVNPECESWDMAMKDEVINFTHEGNEYIDHVWLVDENGNESFNKGSVPSFSNIEEVRRLISPNTLIFHRNKDLSLIPFLRNVVFQ